MDKVFYNEGSAAKLGWEPSWFGVADFDDKLVIAISDWQLKNGIKADGLCGPSTHRRIFTQRESEIGVYSHLKVHEKNESFIVHRGNFLPIEWPKVVLWSEDEGLKSNSGCFTPYFEERKINFFVNHWDVCLNSKSCSRVLNSRGISVHFSIDNDGTIYQMVDMNHAAWHAGSKKWNHSSIGVEITNAYYPKYQSWYERHGYGKRPTVLSELNGRPIGPHLDFYPIQIQALAALWAAIHDGVGINLEVCETKGVDEDCRSLNFNGFINHYNLTMYHFSSTLKASYKRY